MLLPVVTVVALVLKPAVLVLVIVGIVVAMTVVMEVKPVPVVLLIVAPVVQFVAMVSKKQGKLVIIPELFVRPVGLCAKVL